jgi:flagellar basal-body rod modification protein FlgD
MDVSSMMNALQQHDAAKRMAGGIAVNRGNGMLTSATATTGAGRTLASSRAAGAAATGAAAGTATTTTATSDHSQITSSDFLTLLVAEMQNQDPTQPTDPNTYIQQLVGVNSLQQLISINSELGQAVGATGTTSGSSGTSAATPPVYGGVPSGG